jgi:uncharacterized protein YxjI
MEQIQFPLNFEFKITTFSNDFTVADAKGQTFAYVRQKMFKFIEDVQVYSSESKEQLIYNINADRWLDFNAAYSFTNTAGHELGKLVRKGWRSMWKARYHIIDENQQNLYDINEESVWVRVMDNFLGEIPILNFFTGYLFNPTYLVTDNQGNLVLKLIKKPSFFGRKFELVKTAEFDKENTDKVILGLMMMILLERRRG